MAVFGKIIDGFMKAVNGISRLVGIAAPIASAVGTVTGNKDVKEAAEQAKQVAEFAEQQTRDN